MTITDKVLQETERHLRILHTLKVYAQYALRVAAPIDKLAIDTAAFDMLKDETRTNSEYEYYKIYYQQQKVNE